MFVDPVARFLTYPIPPKSHMTIFFCHIPYIFPIYSLYIPYISLTPIPYGGCYILTMYGVLKPISYLDEIWVEPPRGNPSLKVQHLHSRCML